MLRHGAQSTRTSADWNRSRQGLRITPLKPLLFLALITSTLALALTACGGDDGNAGATGPVTMEQRVVTEADAPDSEEDPVEQPESVSGADEFVSRLGDVFVNITPEEISDFKSSGFVEALHVTRFIPESPGGAHTREAPHISSFTMQFDSEQGAEDAVGTLHQDSVRPCPETCAEQAEEFDVADIPGALGTHRYATAESIQATGDSEVKPFDGYEVQFSDGVFAYRVILDGPPGSVSQDEVEEIAKSLYDRVKGAPPA